MNEKLIIIVLDVHAQEILKEVILEMSATNLSLVF